MRIADIYKSIQGEGRLTGEPSVFVRTSGCNLRCWFCDTPFTSWAPEGRDMGVDEVLAHVEEWDHEHVVITGGEPMLFAELIPLCEQLSKAGRHITIETAGTLYLPVTCDLMSISPKLIGSAPLGELAGGWRGRHERTRHAPRVIKRLTAAHDYQIKFVVDRLGDLDEIERYLSDFPHMERDKVWLMPQGVTLEELRAREIWIEPYCREHGLRFCPRRQIEWFGLGRRT
jgi:7-carboxy-7-deazaguanine synthase